MIEIHFYKTSRGEKIVEDFIRSLDPKTRAKVSRVIDLLRERGPELRRPYADHVTGKIKELRIHFASDQIRILYFLFHGMAIMLHVFRKKTEAIPASEIAQAGRRMNDFILRYQKGEFTHEVERTHES